jgi:hypothetical protein
MTEDRKKPGVAFWATVALVVVLVGYPLSFGPACWINGRTHARDDLFLAAYRPFVRAYSYSPSVVQAPAKWYVELWLPPRIEFVGKPDAHWFVYSP